MRVYRIFRRKVRDNMNDPCKGKRPYDKKTAIVIAKRVHNRGRAKSMRIYECPEGPHWHVARARSDYSQFRD